MLEKKDLHKKNEVLKVCADM